MLTVVTVSHTVSKAGITSRTDIQHRHMTLNFIIFDGYVLFNVGVNQTDIDTLILSYLIYNQKWFVYTLTGSNHAEVELCECSKAPSYKHRI